jgi:hypothetical protein
MYQHQPLLMAYANLHKWQFAYYDQGLILKYFVDQKIATQLPG